MDHGKILIKNISVTSFTGTEYSCDVGNEGINNNHHGILKLLILVSLLIARW